MNPTAVHKHTVMVVGGGVTGLGTALALDELGIETLILEKGPLLGGKVKDYDKIFPDFVSGRDIVNELIARVERVPRISCRTGTVMAGLKETDTGYVVSTNDHQRLEVGAIVLASGFEVFDARLQEEYGYGIYPNVINGPELELYLDPHGPSGGRLLRPFDGKPARRVAIIFCVGSRSKRLGNPYCSRICCTYSTKQAIEIMERDPGASVTCFYMDIRTYGRGFEEMYQYAQDLGVKYIRGRVSECSVLPEGDIQVRAENTLLGRPVQGVFDLVSLSVGMMPCADAARLADQLCIERGKDGFFGGVDQYLAPHDTRREGIFLAGSVTGLKPIHDCLNEALSVAGRVAAYLNHHTG